MNEEIKAIRRMLPQSEILAQLAEEAAELSQAALKYRRALDGVNPTPVTIPEAMEHLREEIRDVMLCAELIGIVYDSNIMDSKCKRWGNRLLEVQNGEGL